MLATIAFGAFIFGCNGGGGGGGGDDTCDSLYPQGFPVYLDMLTADGTSVGSNRTITGEVVDIGVGGLMAKCAYAPPEDTAWAKIQDVDGVSWTVCASARNLTLPLEVGQTAQVDLQYEGLENDNTSAGLTIRIGGALVLFANNTLGSSIKPPSEISYSRGEQLCFTPDDLECSVSVYELVVEAGGEQAAIVPGSVADVGGYTFHVGRNTQLGDSGGCEGAGEHVSIFVVP